MASSALIDEYTSLGGEKSDDLEKIDDLELLKRIQALKDKNGISVKSIMNDPTFESTLETLAPPSSVKFDTSVVDPKHPGALSDEDLKLWLDDHPNASAAKNEAELRKLIDTRPFLENITDPKTLSYEAGRLAAQAGAGLWNALDLGVVGPGLYGSITKPLENLGVPTKSTEALTFAHDRALKNASTFNVGDPRNSAESFANIGGGMVTAAGFMKLPALAASTVGVFGLEQGIREIADDEETPYKTIFDQAGEHFHVGTDQTREQAVERAPLIQGGLDLTGPGLLLAPMVAPVVRNAWMLSRPAVPTVTDLAKVSAFAPENLSTLELASDQYLTHAVDDIQALINIGERAGMPDWQNMAKNLDTNTQMSAQMKVNQAVNDGTLHGQYGDFQAPIPPRLFHDSYKGLAPEVQSEYDLYMKLGNYADDLRLQIADPKGPATAPAELAKVQQQRADLRTKYPLLEGWSKQFQQLTEAARNFQGQGPYALFSSKGLAAIGKERAHYVPFDATWIDPTLPLTTRIREATKLHENSDALSWVMNRDYLNVKGIDTRGNSVENLVGYLHDALGAQLHNNVRGEWVQQMKNSSVNLDLIAKNKAPLIREATAEEVGKFPTRVVSVYENGEKKNYITGQLQAQVLRFDPYMVFGALPQVLYATRRGFEHTTTGLLSPVFAANTWIRDTLSGMTNVRAGEKGPGLVGSIIAPAQILSAKAGEAFVNAAEARFGAGKTYIPFVDDVQGKAVVDRVAKSVQNSLYTIAREAGGYDASLMRDRIKFATGAFREIQKSVPPWVGKVYGVGFKQASEGVLALLKMYEGMFDAMQEAPRHSATARNIKAGKSPEDAVAIARRITGNPARSGRVYDANGKMIQADAVNPGALIADNVTGPAMEFLRLGTPYINPTIQGVRRAFGSAAMDPVGFMMRNWLTVGLPSIASHTWNAWLSQENEDGFDYNDYQYNGSSLNDQVMSPLYFAIPGQPPEKGIRIPIAHEQTMFAGPWQQILQHMYSSDEETRNSMTNFGLTLLTNSVPNSLPPVFNAGLNLLGQTSPSLGHDAYDIREDNVGFLPQNIEMAMRSLFNNAALVGLDAAYAFVHTDEAGNVVFSGPEAAAEQAAFDVLSRVPVVKGLIGAKPRVTYGTNLSSEQERTIDSYFQFKDSYEIWNKQGGLLKKNPVMGTDTMDIPIAPFAPNQLPKPINPIYDMFGDHIYEVMEDNDMDAVKSASNVLTDQIRLLKRYNAGNKAAIEEHVATMKAAVSEYEDKRVALVKAKAEYDQIKGGRNKSDAEKAATLEAKQAQQTAQTEFTKVEEYKKASDLIDKYELDLTNPYDTVKLISLLEAERANIMKKQLAIIKDLEKEITDELLAQGLLKPGQSFKMERDLAPMNTSPAGISFLDQLTGAPQAQARQ